MGFRALEEGKQGREGGRGKEEEGQLEGAREGGGEAGVWRKKEKKKY